MSLLPMRGFSLGTADTAVATARVIPKDHAKELWQGASIAVR
jgi:hypothetical protein